MTQSTRGPKAKFADAVRGITIACRGEKNFVVHCIAAILVTGAAAWLHVTTTEWCILLLCIAAVLVAETFNSAIESLAKAVTKEQNEHVGRCLDMSAGAVLLAAIGSAAVGAVIFLPHILGTLTATQ